MSLDNESVDGAEDSQDAGVDNTGSDLKSEIEALKVQNQELLNKMSSFLTPKVVEQKPMTTEEYKALLSENPQAAIEYALEGKVNAKVSQIEKSLTSKQQQSYFDQKAEQDFPLITNDKQFQTLVRQETKSLIEDGMSKDSPKLVYKAAQIAALKYKGAQDTKDSEKSSGSGEAPSNIVKSTSKKHLPKNFDKMASMFNLSDKARARAEENFKFRDEQERKNRG